jgi:hypothetical protein
LDIGYWILDTGYWILDIPASPYSIPVIFQHRASSIQHPASSIRHPASSIEHPASSIRHPASSIQHPASFNHKLPESPHLSLSDIHSIHPGAGRALPAPGSEIVHRGPGTFRFDINITARLIPDKTIDAKVKSRFPRVVAESDALDTSGNTDVSMDNFWWHRVKGCNQRYKKSYVAPTVIEIRPLRGGAPRRGHISITVGETHGGWAIDTPSPEDWTAPPGHVAANNFYLLMLI